MKTKGLCWGCGLPITKGHYHDTTPVGAVLSSSCRELAKAKQDQQRHAVKRRQSSALNGGRAVGKHSKELANRIEKLTVRSRREVADILGCSIEGVRIAELSAMEKIRKALLPFRGATSGTAKVRQVQTPIASLAD